MDKLFDIINRVLKINKDKFKDEYGPNEIESWDSLSHLHLISEVEDIFEIEFDMDIISDIRTIGDIKNALKNSGVEL